MRYGVAIELNANEEDGSAADEVSAYVSSDSWGRVEMGDQDGAADRMFVAAEDILAGRAGFDGDAENYINAGNGLIAPDMTISSDDTKLIYFTPRFSGFQLGASLTPDSGVNGRAVGETDNDGDRENIWEIAANWKGDFGDAGVVVSAFYEGGTDETGAAEAEDVEIFGVGATVEFGGFAVGAGYTDLGEGGLSQAQITASRDNGKWYNIGVAYGTGPWKVSACYFTSEINATDTDFYTVNATYQVAPGWNLLADVNFVSIDNQNGGGGTTGAAQLKNDYTELLVTNQFKF